MKSKKKTNRTNSVFNKDSRFILDTLGSEVQVTSTITSPPYYDMKDYESKNQVGYGQTYEAYLNDLKSIFKDILSITKEDGSLWIIIDTFKRNNQVVTLPFDLSNKLKEIGWLLQDVIIWKKDKTVPWSTNGFTQRKFEYILFFTKSTNFKSKRDKVRVYDTSHLKRWWVKYPERYNPKGKALDEVWEFPIPTQGSWGDKYIRHFCPLPRDMVATMIELSTEENDIVLDPFAGSGTVLSQSAYMKRKYIGFELNKKYIDMFTTYLHSTFEANRIEYERTHENKAQLNFEKMILNLRALKYAKVLLSHIQKKLLINNFKIFVTLKQKSIIKQKLIKVQYDFIGEIDKSVILPLLNELSSKSPLSKFGIEPIFNLVKTKKLILKDIFYYSENNTHSYIEDKKLKSEKGRILSKIKINLNENDYL
ncbi:MAG: site-specific DNA-methyltransferase [Saprospiraceae bacterium]|nr:site-specific DNA-methyltransferase [Saprospiraceae bacterium]